MRGLLLLLAALVAALGCGPRARDGGPPAIHYGEDTCSSCGMIVSDPRYAAALRLPSGESGAKVSIYDDAGELFVALGAEPAVEPLEVWVHDAGTRTWIDGRKAHYVRGGGRTPMGSGVEAFARLADAERRARAVNGDVRDFESLRASVRSGGLVTATPEDP